MDNKEAIEWVRKYNIEKYDDDSDKGIEELLVHTLDPIHSEEINHRRWWKDRFDVVEINGKYVGFDTAETTGDRGPSDVGWEFDFDSICEVEKKVEIKEVVTFVPVKS